MDNRELGEVSFEASGETYTLRYSQGAFIALEEHLNRGILDIFDELISWGPKRDKNGKPLSETQAEIEARVKRMRLGFCRSLFWAGFHDLHKDVSIERAGELMNQIGGMMGAYKLVVEGFSASWPATAEGKSEARPPKRSSSRQK